MVFIPKILKSIGGIYKEYLVVTSLFLAYAYRMWTQSLFSSLAPKSQASLKASRGGKYSWGLDHL